MCGAGDGSAGAGRARDGLYLAGYTIEHGPAPALTGATTEFESLITEDGHTFFKLKRGLVLHGFSGSPLLDLRTGLVAGITESTRGIDSDLGGFAVPAAELARRSRGCWRRTTRSGSNDQRWEDSRRGGKGPRRGEGWRPGAAAAAAAGRPA